MHCYVTFCELCCIAFSYFFSFCVNFYIPGQSLISITFGEFSFWLKICFGEVNLGIDWRRALALILMRLCIMSFLCIYTWWWLQQGSRLLLWFTVVPEIPVTRVSCQLPWQGLDDSFRYQEQFLLVLCGSLACVLLASIEVSHLS